MTLLNALEVAEATEHIYMSAIQPMTISKALQEVSRQLSKEGDTTNND